jgi:DNA-binding transcriptional MocR family regulator
LYEQVAQRITRLIDEGTLRPGDRIPSVRKLCVQQEVSVATVMQAYRLLESRGLIEARPQSGYYVRARRWPLPPEPGMAKPERRSTKVEVSELVMEVIKAIRDPALVRLGATLPSPELFPTLELNRTMAAA